MKTSVKQLKMCHGCPRHWAGHYLFGHPQHQGDAAWLGTQVHLQCAALLKGEPPPFGPETLYSKLAVALLELGNIDPDRDAVLVEVEEKVNLGDFECDLRCDVLELARRRFTDWKTTGATGPNARLPNGKLWALQSLENDWQARVYAHLIMTTMGWESVEAQWIFVSTKLKPGGKPKTWPVRHTFHAEETRAWFERYSGPTVDLIKDLRAAFDEGHLDSLALVPHNPVSCEAKGLFCDVSGHCLMKQSPVSDYRGLHLPVIQ